MKGCWKLKEEALDHIVWWTHSGRGFGPVIRQTTEWVAYTPEPSAGDSFELTWLLYYAFWSIFDKLFF